MWLVVDDYRQFKGDNDNIVLTWTGGVDIVVNLY